VNPRLTGRAGSVATGDGMSKGLLWRKTKAGLPPTLKLWRAGIIILFLQTILRYHTPVIIAMRHAALNKFQGCFRISWQNICNVQLVQINLFLYILRIFKRKFFNYEKE